jgi:hypothetical protein
MGVDTIHLEDEEVRTIWPGTRAQGGATVSGGDTGDTGDSGSGSDSNTGDTGDDTDSTDR